ncbi:MAG: nicotinamide-nucleotide amidohydrolase family protein [Candidatus Sumerlaeia bacterium]|nr:nicotinamide-nucleotide amidohydrolase family protein [Candidatus Sumerlaeia bacterium]
MAAPPVAAVLVDAGSYAIATMKMFGVPESTLAKTLREIERTIDLTPLEITTCLRRGAELEIDVRYRESEVELRDSLFLALRERHGRFVYTERGETIDALVAQLLAGRSIAVAESCTGGLVNTRLTDVPGASRILRRGVVTYADEAKERILGVRRNTLRRHGAVSEACAGEMAQGVRRWAKADLGLAISGIAGPTGGTPDKPIGLVWIAAATRQGVLTERHQIHRPERAAIRAWAADRLLNLARRILEGTAQVT